MIIKAHEYNIGRKGVKGSGIKRSATNNSIKTLNGRARGERALRCVFTATITAGKTLLPLIL